MAALAGITPDFLSASGRGSEKLNITTLQTKMMSDLEGYETDLRSVYSQFNSALELFQQQAALSFVSITGVGADATVAKELGDRAMFLSKMTEFYPKQLDMFPMELADFLRLSARTLPSGLRCRVTQALILLVNKKILDIKDMLSLFMELQTLEDKNLRKLVSSHVVHNIRRINNKHRNEAVNRALQNVLFALLQQEDETKAKRSLATLCELHRRRVWYDDRVANAICMACLHSSSRVMIASMSYLLDHEKVQDDDDSDASSSENEMTSNSQAHISKEAIYKANHKGTAASKRKKKAKLQRALRSIRKQQRLSSQNNNCNNYSPLNLLNDAQGFAEKLFSRLKNCNERFEVKMMMLKLIARTVGLHGLVLLNFYPYLEKYIQPHQEDVTNLLAAAVQACHDMVPPDAIEPLFKKVINQFVHDRSRPEAIAVGLNVAREICLRVPLLMTEDLLQDLALYKKSHEKAVSSAARSLVSLFREICPSLLVKKDRGRPVDPKARPRAFGEVDVPSNVPGIEFLGHDDEKDESEEEEEIEYYGDSDEVASVDSDGHGPNDEDGSDAEDLLSSGEENQAYSDDEESEKDDELDEENGKDLSDDKDEQEEKQTVEEDGNREVCNQVDRSKAIKRKLSDFDDQLIAADMSLRALKKLAEAKMENPSNVFTDRILSNEDFQKIEELKAKEGAKLALARQGLKLPSSEELRAKRMNPAKLEAHIRHKLTKEERLELVRAGREDRGAYQARAAVKKKKTGGSSNQQKERLKVMPLAAKKAKAAKSRQVRKKKQQHSGKQFRGRKVWK